MKLGAKPSLFISYSRKEAPFVHSLFCSLEKLGYPVWLDYHSLIPGNPWQEQIYEGIAAADLFLLVVSKSSLASENVANEWQKAIELGKRIILICFEAATLPLQLESLEWVDLRSSFKKGMTNLVQQINHPQKPDQSYPEKGFRAPLLIWAAMFFSVGAALLSLPTLWTLYVPYYLVPLPYRILKRDFNFFHVQWSLLLLPFALLWSVGIYMSDNSACDSMVCSYSTSSLKVSLLVAPLLLICLWLPVMQRWGKPVSSCPKFAGRYKLKAENPKLIRFSVDAAPEDRRYADVIIYRLEKFGHQYQTGTEAADVVLVLLSAFKRTTISNPQKTVIYPVLLQDTKELDVQLQRIQWIDFRRGLKNLDRLAHLLSEPNKLLKALGVVPVGNQIVLPPVVQVFIYFLTLLAILTVGSWAIFFLTHLTKLHLASLGFIAILLSIYLGIIALLVRALINRRGVMASRIGLLLGLLLLGFLILVQLITVIIHLPGLAIAPSQQDDAAAFIKGGMSIFVIVPLVYTLGMITSGAFSLWFWRDLRRWFPHSRSPQRSRKAVWKI